MGEGVYREVLKSTADAGAASTRRSGAHRDLLAYLVRRLLENGANSSFVHQLADESVGMDELLASPLRLEPDASLPLPPALYGPGRAPQQPGAWTSRSKAMRAPLLAALAATPVPAVPEFDRRGRAAAAPLAAGAAAHRQPSTPVAAERAAVLRRAADALERPMPQFCALLVKEAFKTWGDAVSEVREAVDFLRYYADEAERIMQPVALPGPTGESNELRLHGARRLGLHQPVEFPAGDLHRPGRGRAGRPATPCWPSRPSRRRPWPGGRRAAA